MRTPYTSTLILALALSSTAGAFAKNVDQVISLGSYSISTYSPSGTQPGYISDTGPGGFTMVGVGPSSLQRSITEAQVYFNLGTPSQQIQLPPLPSSFLTMVDTPGPVQVVDLGYYIAQVGAGYRSTVANMLGLPVDWVPQVQRVPFALVELGAVSFTRTSFSYSHLPPSPIPGAFSFTAQWQPNDLPGFHVASYNGLDLTEGVHDYSFNLAAVPYGGLFRIENSDSMAGPSVLKISNLKWSTAPVDPAIDIIQTISGPQTVRFVVQSAIPEPQALGLAIAGLAVALIRIRRKG